MPAQHPIPRAVAQSLAACFLAVAAACAAPHADAADLAVNVNGLRSAQGIVLVALFDAAQAFPKSGQQFRAQMAPAQASGGKVVFRDLPPGRYALTAFHDENANGKLDFNMLGSPLEAVGFSNDAFGSAAAPAFDKAAIEFGADATITINLR